MQSPILCFATLTLLSGQGLLHNVLGKSPLAKCFRKKEKSVQQEQKVVVHEVVPQGQNVGGIWYHIAY